MILTSAITRFRIGHVGREVMGHLPVSTEASVRKPFSEF